MAFPYGFDPSTLRPSETGRDAVTLDDLFSNVPPNDRGHYEQLMQYLTQPKRDMGPAARRAAGGMHAGPSEMDPSPSGMQQQPGVARLMAYLFGGHGG